MYLAGVVRALLNGWDHAAVNSLLLRMPVSGLGATLAGDRFDFGLRETLLPAGPPIAGLATCHALDVFQRMSGWRRERLEPAEWAERLRALGKLVARPAVSRYDGSWPADAWRPAGADACARSAKWWRRWGFAELGAVALDVFETSGERAGGGTIASAGSTARCGPCDGCIRGSRRERRPVVFVCGPGKVFPQYHGENAVMGDVRGGSWDCQRRQTQAQERLLFEMATTGRRRRWC